MTTDSPSLRRVLVLRYHALGDVILATGIVRALIDGGAPGDASADPPCEVEVATESRFLPVFRGLPGVGRLWERGELERAAAATDSGSAASRPRFDQVIDLQGTPASRRLARRLGPRATVRTRSLLRRWIVFWGDRFPRPRIPHATLRYAACAGLRPQALVRPWSAVTEEDEREAERLAPQAWSAPRGEAVALIVGASRRSKEYPRELLLEVARRLEEGGRIVWWIEPPSSDESPVVEPTHARPPASAGTSAQANPQANARASTGARVRRAAEAPLRLPLGALKAILQRAALVVANDSGPMHLATAVGTPVLALFGSTVAGFGFHPAGEHDRILQVEELACRPCSVHGRQRCWQGHWRCLRDLDPALVAAEAQRLLEAIADRPDRPGIAPEASGRRSSGPAERQNRPPAATTRTP